MNKKLVKIIEEYCVEDLETEINNLLQSNIEIFDIKYYPMNCYTNGYSTIITYKDKDKEKDKNITLNKYVKIIEHPHKNELEEKINTFLQENIEMLDIQYFARDIETREYSVMITYKKLQQSE